jgi:hypothetical protein
MLIGSGVWKRHHQSRHFRSASATSVARSRISTLFRPILKFSNIEIAFEEALKLNLAIDECVRKLNSYKRSTTAGKRSSLNLAIHLSQGVITINEAKLAKTLIAAELFRPCLVHATSAR